MARITSSKSPSSDIGNSPSNMKSNIINYIRAGYPGLYLVSHEEQRVAVEMTLIAKDLKYNLVFWSVVDGMLTDFRVVRDGTAALRDDASIQVNQVLADSFDWRRSRAIDTWHRSDHPRLFCLWDTSHREGCRARWRSPAQRGQHRFGHH